MPTYGGLPTIPNLTAITPKICVSEVAGTAPLSIHASAVGTVATFSDGGTAFLALVGRAFDPYMDLEYSWDFGDSAGTEIFLQPVTGAQVNANVDQGGPEAVYIYRSSGSYTITLTARAWDGTQYVTATTSTLTTPAVQYIYIPPSTTGSYTLTFGGQTTSSIAYNATASDVQDALEALSSIGAGNIRHLQCYTDSDLANNVGVYHIFEFNGTFLGQSVSTMTFNASGLAGPNTPRLTVTSLTTSGTTTTIDVSDYSGSTLYVDPVDGQDTNSGSSSDQPKKTWNAAITFVNAGGRRVLLKRGTTVPVPLRINLYSGLQIGAYGVGAKPVLVVDSTQSGPVNLGVGYTASVTKDIVISDLSVDCSAVTGAGISFTRSSLGTITNPWGMVRNILFDRLNLAGGVTNISFSNPSFGFTFWDCNFNSLSRASQGLLIGATQWVGVIGGSFVGGNGNEILDHHIYPHGCANAAYRWIRFGASQMRNFCINTDCQVNGLYTSYILVDGCILTGTVNGLDASSKTAGATYEGRFDEFVVQGNVIHVGQIGGQGYAFIPNNLYRVTLRDNVLWENRLGDISIGDTAAEVSFYRNKVYRSANGTVLNLVQVVSGFIWGNELKTLSTLYSLISLPMGGSTTWKINNNTYYSPNRLSGGQPIPFYNTSASQDRTFAQWQAAGFDADGTYANPGWPDPAHGVFEASTAATTVPWRRVRGIPAQRLG